MTRFLGGLFALVCLGRVVYNFINQAVLGRSPLNPKENTDD